MGEEKTRKEEERDKKVPTPIESWKTPDNIAAAKEMFLDTQIPSYEIGKAHTMIKRISDYYWLPKCS